MKKLLLKLKEKLRIFLFDWYLKRFIKKNLVVEKQTVLKSVVKKRLYGDHEYCDLEYDYDDADCDYVLAEERCSCYSGVHFAPEDLEKMKEPTFTEELIRLIRESGKKDSQIYRAADIDKRLFSKIMSDFDYKPSKDTAIALALALRLSLEEMQDLISRAGYTITHSSKRDLIIEFFFQNKQYRLIEHNAALYRFGEKTLGRTK